MFSVIYLGNRYPATLNGLWVADQLGNGMHRALIGRDQHGDARCQDPQIEQPVDNFFSKFFFNDFNDLTLESRISSVFRDFGNQWALKEC